MAHLGVNQAAVLLLQDQFLEVLRAYLLLLELFFVLVFVLKIEEE